MKVQWYRCKKKNSTYVILITRQEFNNLCIINYFDVLIFKIIYIAQPIKLQWWKSDDFICSSLSLSLSQALTFVECKNLNVGNLRIKNAQQMHLTFQDCENVKASNLIVVAPRRSPNTDGIHVTGTQNIQIMNSIVKTGNSFFFLFLFLGNNKQAS